MFLSQNVIRGPSVGNFVGVVDPAKVDNAVRVKSSVGKERPAPGGKSGLSFKEPKPRNRKHSEPVVWNPMKRYQESSKQLTINDVLKA